MEDDLDDTVIAPARRVVAGGGEDDENTIVRARSAQPHPEASASPPDASIFDDKSLSCYRFVVNVHEPIGLDRPAFIGRKPSLPRVYTGEHPRLVRVPSARGEVSSTHLELQQQGAMVIATDLRSTNGTTVRLPGSTLIRLRQGESVVVVPGSIIEIGDGNVIEILPLQRANPSDQSSGEAPS